ncbi:MAG: HAD-IIB family hydrolase [bacterium]
MKTLYISDLDGTLFTTQKKLTEKTVTLLNECIDHGAMFSVATARMPYGCDYRLEQLHINMPSVLTNGVFIYDFDRRKYIVAEIIANSAVLRVLEVFRKHDTGVFLYTFAENAINLYYNDPSLTEQTQYYSTKALENCGAVACETNPDCIARASDAVYLACTGTQEELDPIRVDIEKLEGVSCAFYLNIYNGLYCIEVFSETASKRNALLKLKELIKCDEIVVFGDNLNDLSMIEIADRSYAVENALDMVKEQVTGVIESCNDDGVAKFIHTEVFRGRK